MTGPVQTERDGAVLIVTIDRPERRNAVDQATADGLTAAFDADGAAKVAVLWGANGVFCAGADLKGLGTERQNRLDADGDGPMGPSRLRLTKPVIAAVAGHAVAGGLELALWCDLRVAARDAVFGVYCRRFGVPLIDGGTVRLPRLIGHSHALDLILTGRGVSGDEALSMGLCNRLCEPGKSLEMALDLARSLAAFPQRCMRADRRSAYVQWGVPLDQALRMEATAGLEVIRSGETSEGARAFAAGSGRHGTKR